MNIEKIRENLGNLKVRSIKEKNDLVLLEVSFETSYISVITDGKMAEVAIEYNDRLSPIGGGFQTLEYEMAVSEPMRLEEVGTILGKLADENLTYPNPLPLWVPRGGKGLMAEVFGISEAFGYADENPSNGNKAPDDGDSLPF